MAFDTETLGTVNQLPPCDVETLEVSTPRCSSLRPAPLRGVHHIYLQRSSVSYMGWRRNGVVLWIADLVEGINRSALAVVLQRRAEIDHGACEPRVDALVFERAHPGHSSMSSTSRLSSLYILVYHRREPTLSSLHTFQVLSGLHLRRALASA